MPQYPAPTQNVYDAKSSILAISAATVLATAGGKKVVSVSVITAGSAGAIYDATATGSPGTVGKAVAAIPATIGVYPINWPCSSGLVVAPGSSQVLAITLA